MKTYRGRELEPVEIVQIYDATRAAVNAGEPLSEAKLPVFDLRAALTGTPIQKRVAVNLQDGTLYSLPPLGVREALAAESPETLVEQSPTRAGGRVRR